MKTIDDLIAELELIRDSHGDLPVAEIQQSFIAMLEVFEEIVDAVAEMVRIIADLVMPFIRQVMVFVRRYGFYCWLHERLHIHHKVAWWVVRRSPDSLVLKLPASWVHWPA